MSQSVSSHPVMRILHTESSLGLGGQELRVLQEVIGMRKRGHQVYLSVPPKSRLATRAQEQGIPLILIPMTLWRWGLMVYQFMKIYAEYDIDIVNTHGSIDSWTASIAGRLSWRSPIIIRSRHKSTPVAPSLRHRWLYGKLPHAVITTGEGVRQGLIGEKLVKASRIFSIPTGVDVNIFFPRKPDSLFKKKMGLEVNRKIIGTIAFLRDYKGVDVFLQAAGLMVSQKERILFLVVGDGPERKNLEVLKEKLGLNAYVFFLGFLDNIPEILSILDVVVLCSVRDEGVPQVLTQALAMEKAVVATNVGSIPEIVQDGVTGFLVPPNSPRELSDRIFSLLKNEMLQKRLGQNGRKLVMDRYSMEIMLDKTEACYHRHLTDRAGQCAPVT